MVVLLNLIVFTIINFIISFLCGTVIYVFHILIAGLNSSANVATIIIAIIIFTLYLGSMIFVSLVLLMNVPNMLFNGYTFKQSIASSINLISKNLLSLIFAFIIPFVLYIPLISIFNFSSVALKIVNIICLIIAIMYYSSLAMTMYYDLSNLTRYDERKYYNIK